jgi:hypothetical protein
MADGMQALGLIWGDVDPFARDFEEVCAPLSAPVHFGARLLFNHWSAKQEKGGMIVGRDVPARALGPALRNLILYEPISGGSNFHVRLAGSALLRRFGRDVTGLNLSDIYEGPSFERHRGEMANMILDRRPFSMDVALKKSRGDSLHFEVLGLTVLHESGARWALVGIFYHDWVG